MASKTKTQRKWEKRKRALESGNVQAPKGRNIEVLHMLTFCKAATFKDRRKESQRVACRKVTNDDD
jgi:hypothetical protein